MVAEVVEKLAVRAGESLPERAAVSLRRATAGRHVAADVPRDADRRGAESALRDAAAILRRSRRALPGRDRAHSEIGRASCRERMWLSPRDEVWRRNTTAVTSTSA